MNAQIEPAVQALNQAFLRLHPSEAIKKINQCTEAQILEMMEQQSPVDMLTVWDRLSLGIAVSVLVQLSEQRKRFILQRGEPVHTARVLLRFDPELQKQLLSVVPKSRFRELTTLVQYPEDSAGALMDPRFVPLSESLTVREGLHRIRKLKPGYTRQLYLSNEDGVLRSMVELHKLALAEPRVLLGELAQPIPATVLATQSREDVVEKLEQHRITDLPVVDLHGRLIGIIRYDALMAAVREESSVDILTMVGASRDERALSRIRFVVRKRLPWLSINLVTAFLAASVVGLFESTIAQFTALAVLLPVVAGQSGNTGAQALAVTMRGLALREIGTSQWLRVARKEMGATFLNGIAIAALTGIGVYLWSFSFGLTLVIASAMIISMLAAAFSGVVIPTVLSSMGQDPAQSSSIILTTITDVVGFFAFLGIAALLSDLL